MNNTDTTTPTTAPATWPRLILYDGRPWHWYGLRSSDGRLLLACPTDAKRGCRAKEEECEVVGFF